MAKEKEMNHNNENLSGEKKQHQEKEILDVDDVSAVQGGYVGKDKYSQADYRSVGLTHVHHTWHKDEYYNAQGHKISQKEAESLMKDAKDKLANGYKYVPGYLSPKDR